jgi:predicted transposase YbfD/YdcC
MMLTGLSSSIPCGKRYNPSGMVEATRKIKGKTTTERRYFVSSLSAEVEQFAHAVRAHWGIENWLTTVSMHYMLDVAFGEDASRIKTDHGPENMAFIRKIALTVARSDKETADYRPSSSVASRIKQMTWSDEYCEKLLFNSEFASGKTA